MPHAWLQRWVGAGVIGMATAATAGAIACAAPAVADPRDWVPWCSGDQTPTDSNCRADPNMTYSQTAPGANPDVPLGLTPGLEPVTGQSPQ